MTTREEVWVRAYCAALSSEAANKSMNTKDFCSRCAEQCLEQFDEVFPASSYRGNLDVD